VHQLDRGVEQLLLPFGPFVGPAGAPGQRHARPSASVVDMPAAPWFVLPIRPVPRSVPRVDAITPATGWEMPVAAGVEFSYPGDGIAGVAG
jgi:hypothetical protein